MKNKLKTKKYAFFGTPRFAEIVLSKLIKEGMTPSLVICNPDRPVGRKKIITPPQVKVLAEKNGLAVYQPENLDAKDIKKKYGEIDFAVIAAYGKIIDKKVIDLFKSGVYGVHPSLLPKYRGASPIQYAILNGEKNSGVTIYKVDEKMDHGPMLIQKKVKIENKNYEEAEKALADKGALTLIEVIPGIVSGKLELEEQNHKEATFTKKIKTQDGFVDIDDLRLALSGHKEESKKIYRKILALSKEPGVYTEVNKKRIKLIEASLEEDKLILKTIQIEGKTPTESFDASIF